MAPQLSQINREHIIALRRSGCRVIDICRLTGITKKTVYFWLRRWEETGALEAHHRQLYTRSTTAADDEAMVAAHAADPFLSTRSISTTFSVSMDTVRRRLKEARKKSCSANINQAHKENQDAQSGNETQVFCPKHNAEGEHTAEGILEDGTKAVIAKVYHYLEQEYEELKKIYGDLYLTSLSNICQRTAKATGVGQTTVLQILKEEAERHAAKQKKPPKKPGKARKKPRRGDSSNKEQDSLDDNGPRNVEDSKTLGQKGSGGTKSKGRQKQIQSDATLEQQNSQGESSTAASSSSIPRNEELDERSVKYLGLLRVGEFQFEDFEMQGGGFS